MRPGERSDVSISSVPYVSETMRVGWMGTDIVRPASSVMLRVSLCGAGVTEQAGRRITAKTAKKKEKSFFSMVSLSYFRIKSIQEKAAAAFGCQPLWEIDFVFWFRIYENRKPCN